MTDRLPLYVGDLYESFDEFLRDAVPDFPLPPNDFDPAQNRGKSTAAWADQNLLHVQLKSTEGTIDDEEFWTLTNRYRQWVNGKFGANTGPSFMDTQTRIYKRPTDSRTPRSEQDCVAAVTKQIISPILDRLERNPKTNAPSALETSGWVIPHLPVDPYAATRATTTAEAEKITALQRVKEFRLDWNGETSQFWVADSESTPSTTSGTSAKSAAKTYGVRVDGLWTLKMILDEQKPQHLEVPRIPGVPANKQDEDDKKVTYLPLGENWKLENYKGPAPVKALFPSEFKRYGTSDIKYLRGLAMSQLALADSYNLSKQSDGLRTDHNLVNMRGMTFVLHQVLHYCARYYTRTGQNSDYKNQITLRLPEAWVFTPKRDLDISRDLRGVVWWMHIDAINTVSDKERKTSFSARDMMSCCIYNAYLEAQKLIHEMIEAYAPGLLEKQASAFVKSFNAKYDPPKPATQADVPDRRRKRAFSTIDPGHRRQRTADQIKAQLKTGLTAASKEMKSIDNERLLKKAKHQS